MIRTAFNLRTVKERLRSNGESRRAGSLKCPRLRLSSLSSLFETHSLAKDRVRPSPVHWMSFRGSLRLGLPKDLLHRKTSRFSEET